MTNYATKHVSELIGLTPKQVRHYVRRGLVQPLRGGHGEYRFSFQDMLLLRTAKQLVNSRVSPRRAVRVLLQLKQDRDRVANLTSVRIFSEGGNVLVRRERELWNAETGQAVLDFARQDSSNVVTELPRARSSGTAAVDFIGIHGNGELDSDDWYNLGLDLEEVDLKRAPEAYRRALALDADNVDAHVNLGRLLQLDGDLPQARHCYQAALAKSPEHQLALYNLGTLHDELDELDSAMSYYLKAFSIPDAHYNLARIHELRGDELATRRHLRNYRRLLEHA